MSLEQESPFDRQTRIPWWDQQKLFRAQVMVAGAGALGNEVLKNLALVGVGHILVVDFDRIEDSNLSRSVLFRQADVAGGRKAEIAAERARQLSPNPHTNVRAFHGDLVWELGAGVYRHLDLVIGCLDNIEARRAVNEHCRKVGIPWIDGGIFELAGSVTVYDASPERACYECSMDEDSYRRARERYSCTNQTVKTNILIGREPTTQTTSAIIAAIQSQEAIKLLHGLESFAGHKAIYHGYRHNFALPEPSALTVVQLGVNPDCLCHAEQKYDNTVVELISAKAAETTARELLQIAEKEFGLLSPRLDLGRSFVVEAVCPLCDTRSRIEKPLYQVTDVEAVCPQCENTCPLCGAKSRGLPDCPNCGQTDINERKLVTLSQLSFQNPLTEPYLDRPLCELGIPPLHILGVRGKVGNSTLFELSGDLETLGLSA